MQIFSFHSEYLGKKGRLEVKERDRLCVLFWTSLLDTHHDRLDCHLCGRERGVKKKKRKTGGYCNSIKLTNRIQNVSLMAGDLTTMWKYKSCSYKLIISYIQDNKAFNCMSILGQSPQKKKFK